MIEQLKIWIWRVLGRRYSDDLRDESEPPMAVGAMSDNCLRSARRAQ